ncbi:MAG: HEAT repeat domain-containing protein [Verrucomicrobia bacterium]|nr:HEAT repeat domain-containing protein [Verrucomicrobiota bacterium]
MRNLRTALILSSGFTAAAALIITLCRDPQPYYNGRSLQEWIKVYARPDWYSPGAQADAEKAIVQIGTNAIPFLVKWIAYKPHPSRTKQFAATIIPMLPLVRDFPPAKHWLYGGDPREFRANAAAEAFDIFGPSASFAIPELAKLAHSSTDPGPADRAVDALANIGPLAFPAVLGVVEDRHAEARFYAVTAIQSFGTNARPAVPILIASLTNSALASAAAETLGHLKLEPSQLCRCS